MQAEVDGSGPGDIGLIHFKTLMVLRGECY